MLNEVHEWWCHKVLPVVYDDSLSYYEVLSKLVNKINTVIKTLNTAVYSVNGKSPENGNVNVGTVVSVNGKKPDENGDVELPRVSGVKSVDDVLPDGDGNIQLNAVKRVNNKTPDENGNVSVGTIVSINDKAPDASGNIAISAANVGAIPNTAGSVVTDTIANGAVTLRKAAAELIYSGEIWRNVVTESQIGASWGNQINWCSGTYTLTDVNLANTYRYWECEIYAGGDVSIIFSNTNGSIEGFNIINSNEGAAHTIKNVGDSYTLTIPPNKVAKLKRIDNNILITGNY